MNFRSRLEFFTLIPRFSRGGAGSTRGSYSTVTLFAKLRGWSTSVPLMTAT